MVVLSLLILALSVVLLFSERKRKMVVKDFQFLITNNRHLQDENSKLRQASIENQRTILELKSKTEQYELAEQARKDKRKAARKTKQQTKEK